MLEIRESEYACITYASTSEDLLFKMLSMVKMISFLKQTFYPFQFKGHFYVTLTGTD